MSGRAEVLGADHVWGIPWRRAVAIAAGVLVLLLLTLWIDLGTGGLGAGLLLALLPVPVYVALALWLDRYEAEPLRLLAKAFAWGAVIAVFLAMLLNEWVVIVTGSELAASLVAAPIVEELLKAIALVLLFHHYAHEFDNVTDGVVYATMIGLGFATTENISFYGGAMLDGTADRVFLLRGALSPFAHPLFTAMAGIGIGYASESRNPSVRAFAPVAGLLSAISLHSLWNASIEVGAFLPVYWIAMVPAFIAVLLVVRRSLSREEQIIRRYLEPEVRSGALGAADVEAICTGPLRALLTPGRRGAWVGGWRELGRLRRTCSELAFERWRVERGIAAAGDRLEPHARERMDEVVARVLGRGRSTEGPIRTRADG